MLMIKPVERYAIAKYPRGRFTPGEPGAAALLKRGGLTALLLAVVEACDTTGVTGPPPVLPEFMTENEARTAITRVFSNHGIALEEDVLKVFEFPGVTATIKADGFNDSLQVGYEYLSERETLSPDVRRAFADAIDDGGPYVKILDTAQWGYYDTIENSIEAFIDTLKAHGAI